MDELKERRDAFHRKQAYVKLLALDMPQEIAELTFDYLQAYRDTMVTYPEARKQISDLEKLTNINPIELIDITLEDQGKWTFSVEGVRLFSILTYREDYPGTFDIHGGTLRPKEEKGVKWAEELTQQTFGRWLTQNTNQAHANYGRDPSEYSVPLTMVAYLVSYLAMRATGYLQATNMYADGEMFLEFGMEPTHKTQHITLHLLADFWKP